MNLENYTIKSQEAIQKALYVAEENRNQAIEPEHLLYGIIDVDNDVITYVFGKFSISIENIKNVLTSQINNFPKVTGAKAYLSDSTSSILKSAENFSKKINDLFVTIEHLIYGLIDVKSKTRDILIDAGFNKEKYIEIIKLLRKGSNANSQNSENNYNSLNRYAINLNNSALNGKLDPVIGRDEEIRRILQILSRRTKNNPILIGEPGVGKTAIAEGLAQRIISGDVPENLKSKVIYSLDMGALIAGAKYKGEFEERLKSVVKEVVQSNGEIILFIDEIHTLVGAGKSDGAMDAANILKPALARGDLRAVGATTLNEYQKYFEKDKALERRFQIVMVDEPDTFSTISILRGLKEKYESHHKVRILDSAIIAAVELSHRYITERFLPDKAIDLIDEAASRLRIEMNSIPEEIDDLNRKIKQLEIEKEVLKIEGEKFKIDDINRELSLLNETRNILNAKWSNEKDIIEKIQVEKENIEKYKFSAEQAEREGNYGLVAELRYGKIKQAENNITKLKTDLNNIQKENPLINEEVDRDDIAEIVSRWTGIPVNKMIQSEINKLLSLENELHKRVVGQDEAIIAISNAVRRSRAGMQDAKRPIGSFIFLGSTGVGKTELAKALAEYLFNDENLLTRIDMSEYQERHSVSRLIGAPPGYIGYDEGGQLTEAVRRKPYSVVLLDEIEKAHPDVFNILLQVLEDGRLTDNKGRVVNFKNTIIIMTSNLGSNVILENYKSTDTLIDNSFEKTKNLLFGLLRETIKPEFLNRIDEIIVFTPLNLTEIKEIVKIQMELLKKNLLENGVSMSFTDNLANWIAEIGFDSSFGARPIKRLIQKEILNELSKRIISGEINKNKDLIIDFDEKIIIKCI